MSLSTFLHWMGHGVTRQNLSGCACHSTWSISEFVSHSVWEHAMWFLICSSLCCPFWSGYEGIPHLKTYLIPSFPGNVWIPSGRHESFKVVVSNSGRLSMPCGQFTSVELPPSGELNFRLALLSCFCFLERWHAWSVLGSSRSSSLCPAQWEAVIRPWASAWILTQPALAIFVDIHMLQMLSLTLRGLEADGRLN